MRVACLNCRDNWIEHDHLVCHRCLGATDRPDQLMRHIRDTHQQYRIVISQRFSDTKAFLNRMRAAAHVAGCEPVEGPTAVRIVGQRAVYGGTRITAYQMVKANLDGVLFGALTDVQSASVTLLTGGYDMTVVEVRALLDDELAGVAGVAR